MNHDGRSTVHSGTVVRTNRCRPPSPVSPSGMADELSSTTRRTPACSAVARNGSTSDAGSVTPMGATR
jgi:hypothetical protein